ncbi:MULTISPECIES: hypothetical protein [unclassified Pseudomonas]|uniref:Uncharacterized protein n=1 Tax=Pseudomonas sp. MYb327 TaxID=2745230 RepID=A0AAU8E9A2_9PSED
MKKKVLFADTHELLEADLKRTERAALQGASFYWEGEVLAHLGGTSFFMTKALSQMSSSMKASFKQQVISFIDQGDYATSSYVGFFSMLQSLLNSISTSSFDLNWIAQALENSGFRRNKKMMTRFLLQWRERDSNIIDQDVLSFLNDASPHRNGPRHVLSDDPEKSWLTNEEYDGLLSVVWKNYDNGTSCTQVTLIKLLSMQYARRPIQIAYLKVGDICNSDSLGNIGHYIDFPGAKDLAAETSFRDSKPETHPLPDHIWDLCCIQLQEVRELYENVLSRTLTDDQFKILPLFCSKRRIKEAQQLIETRHQYNLLDHLGSELLHLPK